MVYSKRYYKFGKRSYMYKCKNCGFIMGKKEVVKWMQN